LSVHYAHARCAAHRWKAAKPKPKPKPPPALCYDCDYDPDDAQVGQGNTGGKKGYGWAGYGDGGDDAKSKGGRRGFPRCALDKGDERFVSLTQCHSKVCFIRKDNNGRQYTHHHSSSAFIMPRPHRAEALSDDARLMSVCLTSVCLSRTSGLSIDNTES